MSTNLDTPPPVLPWHRIELELHRWFADYDSTYGAGLARLIAVVMAGLILWVGAAAVFTLVGCDL